MRLMVRFWKTKSRSCNLLLSSEELILSEKMGLKGTSVYKIRVFRYTGIEGFGLRGYKGLPDLEL